MNRERICSEPCRHVHEGTGLRGIRLHAGIACLLAVSLMLAACGGSDDEAQVANPPVAADPPASAPASAPAPVIVGAQGGTVSSADGRVTLAIPAAALAADVAWTITPETTVLPDAFTRDYAAVAGGGYAIRGLGGGLPVDQHAVLTIARGGAASGAAARDTGVRMRNEAAGTRSARSAEPGAPDAGNALFVQCDSGDTYIVWPTNERNSLELVSPIDGCLPSPPSQASNTHVTPVRIVAKVAVPGWSRAASAAGGPDTGSDYYSGPGGFGRALAARGNQVAIVDEAGNLLLDVAVQGLPPGFRTMEAKLDRDGAFYLAGEQRSSCPGGQDLLIQAVIARFDIRVSLQQGTVVGTPSVFTVAGTPLAGCPSSGPYQWNHFNGMAVDPGNGDAVFIGHVEGMPSDQLGLQGDYIARVSRQTNTLSWARATPSNSPNSLLGVPRSVTVDADGSAYFASNGADPDTASNVAACGAVGVDACLLVSKFDSAGLASWNLRASAKVSSRGPVVTGVDAAGGLWVAAAFRDVDIYASIDATQISADGTVLGTLSVPGVGLYKFDPFGPLRFDGMGRLLIGLSGDLRSSPTGRWVSGDYVYRLGSAPAIAVLGLGTFGSQRGFGVDAGSNDVIGIQLDTVTNNVACPSGRLDCPGLNFGSFALP